MHSRLKTQLGLFYHTDKSFYKCIFCFSFRRFFYPHQLMAKTKVDDFVTILNKGQDGVFEKRLSLTMTSNQLDSLLTEMESRLEIPQVVPRAVMVVGKNSHPSTGKNVWILNQTFAVNENGESVSANEEGYLWISNLVDLGCPEVANTQRVASIHLPLTTQWFDIMCHFLKGTLPGILKKDPLTRLSLEVALDEATMETFTAMEDMTNANYMSIFYTISMSIIMANYDTVSVLCILLVTWNTLLYVESGNGDGCSIYIEICFFLYAIYGKIIDYF